MSLSDLESRLCETIASKADSMLDQLAKHVAIPTGHNHVPGLEAYRDLLIDRLKAIGATIEFRDGVASPEWFALPGEQASEDSSPTIMPIVVARRDVNPDSPRILLSGHLDTVHDPQGDFQELTKSEDGKFVIGPGAVDMKGGVLVMITALETLHALRVEFNWIVVLNSDEERGSFQSMNVLQEIAKECDLGLVFEPALADGSLAIERMGSGQFKIEVHGQSAHVGREFEKGVSAVTRLGELLVELSNMADPRNGMILNVGPLQGGSVTNAVPDYAACWGNMRVKDAEAVAKFDAMLDALVTTGEALPRVKVHRLWNRPHKPLTDEVQKLADQARDAAEDLEQRLPFASTGGVCEGNGLQAAGLPVIDTLGVRGGNLHRTDEFVEVASLVERTQLLAVLLTRLSQSTS